MTNTTTLDEIQDRVASAVQSDLEHGVAWMNEEASKKYVKDYPEINKLLGWISELYKIQRKITCSLCVDEDSPSIPVGMTPKGEKIPQTAEEFHYLANLYEKGLLEAQMENTKLKIKINSQTQRLEKQRKTIRIMFEEHNNE